MMLMFLLFLFWTCPGSESKISKIPTNIRCLVMNLEYVNCTWAEDGLVQESYRFKSRFESHEEVECSTYVKANNVNVGCILPYSEKDTQRFSILDAWVYRSNDSVITEHHSRLLEMVKLDPPHNLTRSYREPELWLYWNTTSRTKPSCKESEVRYRINSKEWKLQSVNTERNSFNMPFPSDQNLYEFQVRVRMSYNCGQSNIWSEWSSLVQWGCLKNTNDTAMPPATSVALMVMYIAGAVVLLIILSCLLVRSERLRVILVPVVPSPKNLGDLINSYDGNVEKWLSISKELQDGFKPNFTERPCPVREYRLVPQVSDSVLSCPALAPDYQIMQNYSASTLSVSRETTQAPPLATTCTGL